MKFDYDDNTPHFETVRTRNDFGSVRTEYTACHSHPRPREASVLDKPSVLACMGFFKATMKDRSVTGELTDKDRRQMEAFIEEDKELIKMLQSMDPAKEKIRVLEARLVEAEQSSCTIL
jgi:hypothetical protein